MHNTCNVRVVFVPQELYVLFCFVFSARVYSGLVFCVLMPCESLYQGRRLDECAIKCHCEPTILISCIIL